MIEKIDLKYKWKDPMSYHLMDKINEIIDAIEEQRCKKDLILIAKYLHKFAEDEGYIPDITNVTDEDARKIIDEITGWK
jgi:hypothetical protein